MDSQRIQEPAPIGVVIRSGRVLVSLALWLALWIALYGMAGYRYAKVAVARQPDLLKSVVRLTAAATVEPSQDSFDLEVQATTPLPSEGVEMRIQAELGAGSVTLPADPVRLSNDQPAQTVRISLPLRTTQEPVQIALMARPLTPDTVLVLPREPLQITILPRPRPSILPTIRLSAPAEVAAHKRQFEVQIALHDGRRGETAVVTVEVYPAGAAQPEQHRVTLSDVDPRAAVKFVVSAAPSTRKAISLLATSADGHLKDRASLALLPGPTPVPAPEPLLAVKIASPQVVPPTEREIHQTVSWNGPPASVPRSLRVTHNASARVTPASQDVDFRESSGSKPLTWKLVSSPLGAEQTIQFQAAADGVAPVAPWTVMLQSLLKPETQPAPLLVIIDTTLLREDTAPWFAPLIRDVMRVRRGHLRSETAIVLRKDGPPEPWTETTAFGATGAYMGATSAAAMRQLADILKQDDASLGPVVVVWANAFAPPGDAAILYPLSRKRALTIVWMNVKNASEQGLFAAWDRGDSAERFQVELLAAPENLLKTSLDQLLSLPER